MKQKGAVLPEGEDNGDTSPTQDALLQHTKRVAYQAGIRSTSEQSEQHAPTPDGWGWTLDENSQSWVPVWNMLPVASKACSKLVKCRLQESNWV